MNTYLNSPFFFFFFSFFFFFFFFSVPMISFDFYKPSFLSKFLESHHVMAEVRDVRGMHRDALTFAKVLVEVTFSPCGYSIT